MAVLAISVVQFVNSSIAAAPILFFRAEIRIECCFLVTRNVNLERFATPLIRLNENRD